MHIPFNEVNPNLPSPFCFCKKCRQAREQFYAFALTNESSDERKMSDCTSFMFNIYDVFQPTVYTTWGDYMSLLKKFPELAHIDSVASDEEIVKYQRKWNLVSHTIQRYHKLVQDSSNTRTFPPAQISYEELAAFMPNGIDIWGQARKDEICTLATNGGVAYDEVVSFPLCEHVCEHYGYLGCRKNDVKKNPNTRVNTIDVISLLFLGNKNHHKFTK